MKVLFNTYPMAFHTPGGGEIQLLQYKKFLSETGVKVKLLDIWNPHFRDYDVVHFFSCMSGSLHFCAFIKKIGLPLLVSPNLWITEEHKHLYPHEEIRTQFILADKVIGNSDSECDLLAQVFNMPREKFVTVYNGVDELFFESVSPNIFREHFGIYGPFILNVANLEPRKNQLQLAKAIKDFPNLTLVIIGYERDIEYAQQCFVEGGDQLRYLGALPHDSELLRSAFAACELFVLPSTLETPGLAALEAAAVGAKVVVTSEGSAKEYFGEGAVYVDNSDVQNIVQGIQVALSEPHNLLTSLCMRANFTWQHVIKNLAEVYRCVKSNDIEAVSSSGFFQIEKDAHNLFAWTKKQVIFKYSNGVLSFNWRSVEGAEVDVIVDGLYDSTFVVGAEWQLFNFQITSLMNKNVSEICLEVRGNNEHSKSNPLGLGVAIKDVGWRESSGELFKPKDIVARGFYPVEKSDHGLFVWSRLNAKLFCKEGHLSFNWRSVEGAEVDVIVDGLYDSTFVVGAEWQLFNFQITSLMNKNVSEICLEVRGNNEHSKSNPLGLGVAIKDVGWRESSGELFKPKDIVARGFYPVEKSDHGLFVWSRLNAKLFCKEGHLSFNWRSVEGAEVDVIVDGVIVHQGIFVDVNWTPFNLSIKSPMNANESTIELVITTSFGNVTGDMRELGVAIRDVSFN